MRVSCKQGARQAIHEAFKKSPLEAAGSQPEALGRFLAWPWRDRSRTQARSELPP